MEIELTGALDLTRCAPGRLRRTEGIGRDDMREAIIVALDTDAHTALRLRARSRGVLAG